MPLLEVIALDAQDARGAAQGGADRLEVVADMETDGLTPTEDTVAEIRNVCDLPLRVMLRARPDFFAGDLDVLVQHASRLVAAGADGFVLGFLTIESQMDTAAMRELGDRIGLPWTCHRAVDHAVDHARAIAAVTGLAGMDQILTAGDVSGLAQGIERVCASAERAPLLAGGGLKLEQLPRLRASGVQAFHIGSAAREHWGAPVDPRRVARWTAALGE